MTGTGRAARRQTLRQIFIIPSVVALLSAIGLVSALVGDGIWDGLSWITLVIPIALGGYYLMKARR
jgi:hypothetical protein